MVFYPNHLVAEIKIVHFLVLTFLALKNFFHVLPCNSSTWNTENITKESFFIVLYENKIFTVKSHHFLVDGLFLPWKIKIKINRALRAIKGRLHAGVHPKKARRGRFEHVARYGSKNLGHRIFPRHAAKGETQNLLRRRYGSSVCTTDRDVLDRLVLKTERGRGRRLTFAQSKKLLLHYTQSSTCSRLFSVFLFLLSALLSLFYLLLTTYSFT